MDFVISGGTTNARRTPLPNMVHIGNRRVRRSVPDCEVAVIIPISKIQPIPGNHPRFTIQTKPIITQCSWCKKWKIKGAWVVGPPANVFIHNISHGCCPECVSKEKKKWEDFNKQLISGGKPHDAPTHNHQI